MPDSNTDIEKMVANIMARLRALDANRRSMLFRWLQAHHAGAYIPEACLAEYLNEWFRSLPAEGAHLECRLILSEIAWWCNLDESALAEFMVLERPAEFDR